ncbi:MAG: hypothetical protein ACK4MY_17065 [Brevundimonas sp.]
MLGFRGILNGIAELTAMLAPLYTNGALRSGFRPLSERNARRTDEAPCLKTTVARVSHKKESSHAEEAKRGARLRGQDKSRKVRAGVWMKTANIFSHIRQGAQRTLTLPSYLCH